MSVARRATNQLLASKSVHIRIQPRPANLAESREIFRVLQRFGEISTYKYLRYEYHNPADNSALAIYRDPDSAQQALNASPIRFALEKVSSDDGGLNTEGQLSGDESDDHTLTLEAPVKDGIEEITRPSRLINRALPNSHASLVASNGPPEETDASEPAQIPYQDPPASRPTNSKWFQITVDRSRVVHQDFVERQPYWKQFSPMKSMAQEDLAKVVPHIGLSDVSKRPANQHRTPNKVLKMMSFYVENRMKSLREMYEEGGRGKD
ncbi:hypothetical protein K469DRAFT_585902 [Zopfia rhizophila CBS 207.26]|uniref:Uncharacterized protein n=1 Tax=Zopfia rhizophila CBS 207.26 TaxID=1314779 RepID=A0A6A6DTY2_9PEZI|nr:hypothetical protein K469DRAFT_585902 [Zopfia rhizophila CBS 207.26]